MATVRISVFPFVFGILFLTAALSRGFTGEQAMWMSITVFAGSVLFAGMEIWSEPLPYVALAVTAFSVGSRHILMGLTLPPVFKRSSRRPPLLTLFFLTDLNWLLTSKAHDVPHRFAYFLGSTTLIYSTWVIGSLIGWGVAGLIDQTTIDATRSMGTIFIALVILMLSKGFKGSRWPWLAAALASAAVGVYAPRMATLAGVLTGTVTAAFVTKADHAE